MREAKGNIWGMGGIVCVTTNGIVDSRGRAVMGSGIAKEARDAYPDLPTQLAACLKNVGNHVFVFDSADKISGIVDPIITFPTKEHWRDPSPIDLIVRSCHELMELADRHGTWDRILLPRPGCGRGGLDWGTQVKPAIEGILDDRVTIVTF